jgi:hypothetical protein
VCTCLYESIFADAYFIIGLLKLQLFLTVIFYIFALVLSVIKILFVFIVNVYILFSSSLNDTLHLC